MSLKVYNTLSRKKELFKPLKGDKVSLFVCGPTVYDDSHIGHAKTYVQFDLIVKYLRYLRYKVYYLQNITDIDDKIIKRAKEKNISWKQLARRYESCFLEDMKSLNVTSVNKYARATDYIKEIQSQIKRLIQKGYAYKISDGWYFDLTKFKEYEPTWTNTIEIDVSDEIYNNLIEDAIKNNDEEFLKLNSINKKFGRNKNA